MVRAGVRTLFTATLVALGAPGVAVAESATRPEAAGSVLARNDFDLPLDKRWSKNRDRTWGWGDRKVGNGGAKSWSRLRKWRESLGDQSSGSKREWGGWPGSKGQDKNSRWQGWPWWKGQDKDGRWEGWSSWWKGQEKGGRDDPWDRKDEPWKRYGSPAERQDEPWKYYGSPWDQWRRYAQDYYRYSPSHPPYYADERYGYPPRDAYPPPGAYAPRDAYPPPDAYPPGYDDDRDEVWGWMAFTAVALKLLDNLDRAQQREHERAMTQAEAAPLGEPVRWSQGAARGSVTPTRAASSPSGRPCREFRHEIVVNGRKQIAYETACQAPDGSWEIVR
jgi:hypothetical protein